MRIFIDLSKRLLAKPRRLCDRIHFASMIDVNTLWGKSVTRSYTCLTNAAYSPDMAEKVPHVNYIMEWNSPRIRGCLWLDL